MKKKKKKKERKKETLKKISIKAQRMLISSFLG